MTTILNIKNDFSTLITDEYNLKHTLWNCLRFRERNYFHNRGYKQRVWDGYTEFFKLETGKFLTGLLPEIQAALNHFKIKYEIEDERTKTNWLYDKIDENFLKTIKYFDYQVELINQTIKHSRGVIYAPTGAGKSLIMIGILKCLPPETPTLVLQNRVTLAEQNHSEALKWGIKGLGTLWGGAVKPNTITIGTFQSIARIEKELPKIKAILVDEIHEGMSKLPKAIYKRLKAADIRIALSATPFKFGDKDKVQKHFVKGFFGPVLKIKSTKEGILTTNELQKKEILSSSKCIFYPINEPPLPYDIYIDAVTHGIAENSYFHKIVVKLAKKLTGRTLILVERIAHGDALNKFLPNSLWIQGKDDSETRNYVVEQLKVSKNCCAIATPILNTGVNFFVNNLINAAGGQAEHQIIQRMGRGLRTASDKNELNYYDFIFNINPYLLNHSKKRIKILKKQGHEVEIKKEIDF